jgi:sigma-54-specific transcriptional regulator
MDNLAHTAVLTFPEPRSLSLSIRATALVFEDPLSRALLARIQQIAPSEATALIIGDTGTGKELIARHIHALSRRAQGPFVAVNCAALPENLVESELFGHEKGAFTGAVAAKAGWFEAARGGTLFLDEIGDLPLGMQVKLLRVLQEREVVRVGSRQPIPVDVRLIAATNVDLAEAVRAGHFREDLYFRLNVVPLFLSPLRRRPADILPLARHYLQVYGERLGGRQARLADEASETLLQYAWPGNIRELENVIHHAMLVCSDGLIRPGDLHLAGQDLRRRQPETAETAAAGLDGVLRQWFEQAPPDLYEAVDRLVVGTAYDYCERNQVQTARLLGISRNILRARLQRYGLLPGCGVREAELDAVG